MNVDNWLFEIRNKGSWTDQTLGYNSLKEFKLKIIYIAILGQMENGEVYLSYGDIIELVEKYSAGTIKLHRQTLKRMVDEIVEVGALIRINDLKGKISKSLYKINGGY